MYDALCRGVRALTKKYNIYDASIPSQLNRWEKYSLRGFCVAVPGLSIGHIGSQELLSIVTPDTLITILKRELGVPDFTHYMSTGREEPK